MTFVPVQQDRCDGCGRNREGYYLRRAEHMADAFRRGTPLPTIASGYGMSQEWAIKLIQEQLGLEAVRTVQEQHRAACDMCSQPLGDDPVVFVNDLPVHEACLAAEWDPFADADIEDRLLARFDR